MPFYAQGMPIPNIFETELLPLFKTRFPVILVGNL